MTSKPTAARTIPRESQPPTPPQPGRAAVQAAEDRRLEKQQEAESAQRAAVANGVVQKAQAQYDAGQQPAAASPAMTPPGMRPVDSEDRMLTPEQTPPVPAPPPED